MHSCKEKLFYRYFLSHKSKCGLIWEDILALLESLEASQLTQEYQDFIVFPKMVVLSRFCRDETLTKFEESGV